MTWQEWPGDGVFFYCARFFRYIVWKSQLSAESINKLEFRNYDR